MKHLKLSAVAALSAAFFIAAVSCRSESVHDAVEPVLEVDLQGEPVGLEHYRRWSDHIGQSGEPVGEQAFENIAALGFKRVVSVDGAAPNVESARKWGLQYVHVPIGYDGITEQQALEIVKAVQSSDGPVLVHCHHGLHRGPAAAMIARIGCEGLVPIEAVEAMKLSGTSPKYKGLYRDVQNFVAPSAEALAQVSSELPESRAPKGLIASMSYIDRRWDFVLAGKEAKWGPLADHADIDVAHEIGMIENTLRTLVADEEKKAAPDPKFRDMMRECLAASQELEAAVRAQEAAKADGSFARLKNACDACHAEYRNN
jgi:protein tyrosine phosphatase (PTP) superfamily phosphohydrolase (DUF442 family)